MQKENINGDQKKKPRKKLTVNPMLAQAKATSHPYNNSEPSMRKTYKKQTPKGHPKTSGTRRALPVRTYQKPTKVSKSFPETKAKMNPDHQIPNRK